VRKNADGSLRMHYDPAIAVPFNAELVAEGRGAVELLRPRSAADACAARRAIGPPQARTNPEQMAVRGPRAKSWKSPESATRRPASRRSDRDREDFLLQAVTVQDELVAIICSPKRRFRCR